jgi:hypothetical protein
MPDSDAGTGPVVGFGSSSGTGDGSGDYADSLLDAVVALIEDYAYTDGAHHKQWVLNEVYKVLTGQELDDPGIAP